MSYSRKFSETIGFIIAIGDQVFVTDEYETLNFSEISVIIKVSKN